jgi:hypothetical protein
MDAVDAGAGFIYGDDDPGFWFTGDFGSIELQVGYHKKLDSNFASRDEEEFLGDQAGVKSDNDRDLYDAMLTYHINDDNEVRFMALYDVMKTRSDTTSNFGPFGTDQKGADVETYRLGVLYTGKLGIVEPEFEAVYQGGTADNAVNEFG